MAELPARFFGITSNVEGLGQGLIANSLSFNESVESAEARNEKGEIIDIAAYSKQKTVDVNGVYVGAGVAPGTIVSIGGEDFLVTNSTKNENNTTFQEGSISCRNADKAVLHTLAEIQGEEEGE